MRKIFLFLNILLILGVVTNSCISEIVKEEVITPNPDPNPNPNPDPDPNVKKVYKFQTTIETTAFAKRLNMGNDRIGLFLYNGDNVVQGNASVTLSNGNGQHEVTTSYTNALCFGYYPHSTAALSANTIYTGAITAAQDQAVTSSSNVADVPSSLANQLLMVSNQSTYTNFNDNTASIQFSNVLSLLRFSIAKNSSLNSLGNLYLKKAEIYISNVTDTLTPLTTYKLAGTYSLDLKSTSYVAKYPIEFASSYSSKITANITNSPLITNSDIILWSVVPPLEIASNKLVIHLEMEDDLGYKSYSTQTFSNLNVINRNEIKTLTVILNSDNFTSDNIVKAENNFVSKPANSYVVSESGLYAISTKKPDGSQVAGGDNVVWLWASKAGGGSIAPSEVNNLISRISYDFDSKEIKFRVGSNTALNKGNVILALRDATGNILWTWHIWITDKPQDVMYENGKRFMDRNIGALAKEYITPGIDNYGFVYQWGRKDPFFGGNGLVNETASGTVPVFDIAEKNTVINNEATWGNYANRWSQIHTSTGSIDMATKYPMWFICNNDNTVAKSVPLDWLSPSNPNLWSDSEKTGYDPCPYGYKVPSKGDVSSLSEFEADGFTPKYFKYMGYKFWDYSYGGISSMWPSAGMRQGRSSLGNNTGAQLIYSGTNSTLGQCFYWTSSQINVDGITLTGGSHRVYTTNGIPHYTIYKNDYGDNADAYPVRCVKMP